MDVKVLIGILMMNLVEISLNKIIDLKYNNEETSETESNPLDDINIIECQWDDLD